VHFFGWFQNDNAIFIAMEYLQMGDLENNLQELEKSNYAGCALSEEEVKDIITNILEGIKIMHAEGFAHRDLKPQVWSPKL
jgi:serine/threonine protein kinase